MIISASRRTDIPAQYSDWFFHRLQESYVLVRNPMNHRQVSKISLSPEVVDCIVFWSKNPRPLLENLDKLNGYPFYIQFTFTPYGQDIEPGVPSKKTIGLETFQRFSESIGKSRVLWRYDPVLISQHYTAEYHVQAFGALAEQLHEYTEVCTFSFLDVYSKISKRLQQHNIRTATSSEKYILAKSFAAISHEYGLSLRTCAEDVSYPDLNISPAQCIDDRLIQQITGFPLNISKDSGQRPACGCVESIDIGYYGTCLLGCVYCYANHSPQASHSNHQKYSIDSPLLCGALTPEDRIKERKVKSHIDRQLRMY